MDYRPINIKGLTGQNKGPIKDILQRVNDNRDIGEADVISLFKQSTKGCE